MFTSKGTLLVLNLMLNLEQRPSYYTFIYKVNNETSERDVTDYISQRTNICVTVKKINIQKHNRYGAFKMFISNEKLSLFLANDLWPAGVLCRKFIYSNRSSYDSTKVDEPILDKTQNKT